MAIRSLKTRGISRPAHFFSASILGLAEHVSPLRQLLAREGKTDGRPPPAQSRYLVHTQGSPSDALHPLIEKTRQGLDKSLAVWLHRNRDTVQQAPHLTDEEKLSLPLAGGPNRALPVLRRTGLEPVIPARGLWVFSLGAHWCLDSRPEVWLHCRACIW